VWFSGGLDQGGHEGDPGHPQPHGGAQPSPLRHPQRPQHVETARGQRPAQRRRRVHVPDQHRPHENTGEFSPFFSRKKPVCFLFAFRLFRRKSASRVVSEYIEP